MQQQEPGDDLMEPTQTFFIRKKFYQEDNVATGTKR